MEEQEWQPVRIAQVVPSCRNWELGTQNQRWSSNVGKIVRVREYGIDHGEVSYKIHPEDLHILDTEFPFDLLCEHQILAD